VQDETFGLPLVSTFIKQQLQESVETVMENALSGLETANYELEFETKSKETRYLLVNATTKRDSEGKIIGVVGVAQDLTDDKKHTKELQILQSMQDSQDAKVETEVSLTQSSLALRKTSMRATTKLTLISIFWLGAAKHDGVLCPRIAQPAPRHRHCSFGHATDPRPGSQRAR